MDLALIPPPPFSLIYAQLTKRSLYQLQMEINALQNLRHMNVLELRHVVRDAVYRERSGEAVGILPCVGIQAC